MFTKRIALFAAAVAMLVSADAAFAQRYGRGPVATFCAADINRHCNRLHHGRGEVRACLQSNWRRLSQDCRSVLRNSGGGQRRR
ncbi:cysteine rich repeat-containing protein [Rhodomicrobium sp. Az07]|nr:cysteine rich repeat-containing protein [Rhodomicrobium sp. Az07]